MQLSRRSIWSCIAISLGAAALCLPLPAAGYDGDLVLAVSWQPAFCEMRSERPECSSQTEDRFDATHFALHGLWPQPRSAVYCRFTPSERDRIKSTPWSQLPALQLHRDTRSALERAMPGTRSYLHRHEWTKHGTCYSETPEIYYRDSLELLSQLNRSPLRNLFAENIGRTITADDIRIGASSAFGQEAGRRVTVHCRNDGDRRLIVELRLRLRGPIDPGTKLGALMATAPTPEPSCLSGVIDPVGLQ